MYVCMYVYCTCYAPICHANGMEKASFARIVGAEEEQQTTYRRPSEKNEFLV